MNASERKKREANEEQRRRQQMEGLRAVAQDKDATRQDEQSYLNYGTNLINRGVYKSLLKKKQGTESGKDSGFDIGRLAGAIIQDIGSGDTSFQQTFGQSVEDEAQDVQNSKLEQEIGREASSRSEQYVHGLVESEADRGNANKRYPGFINLYSRNFRRVVGDGNEEEADASKVAPWAFATGQLSPYIDAKADEELQDGGEPGFWNMYSGIHNLVGKQILSHYGVHGG